MTGVNYRYTENLVRPLKIGNDGMLILHRISDSASTKMHRQVRSKHIIEIEHEPEPEPEQHQTTSETIATNMGKLAAHGSSSSSSGIDLDIQTSYRREKRLIRRITRSVTKSVTCSVTNSVMEKINTEVIPQLKEFISAYFIQLKDVLEVTRHHL